MCLLKCIILRSGVRRCLITFVCLRMFIWMVHEFTGHPWLAGCIWKGNFPGFSVHQNHSINLSRSETHSESTELTLGKLRIEYCSRCFLHSPDLPFIPRLRTSHNIVLRIEMVNYIYIQPHLVGEIAQDRQIKFDSNIVSAKAFVNANLWSARHAAWNSNISRS